MDKVCVCGSCARSDSRQRGKDKISFLPQPWHERDDVLYVQTWSDGTSGEAWVGRLEGFGRSVNSHARGILKSPEFRRTHGVLRVVAILTGKNLFGCRSVEEVRDSYHGRHGLTTPGPEIGCILRELLVAQHFRVMGLSHIVVGHTPIKNRRLVVGAHDELKTCPKHRSPDLGKHAYGIAFIACEHQAPCALLAA